MSLSGCFLLLSIFFSDLDNRTDYTFIKSLTDTKLIHWRMVLSCRGILTGWRKVNKNK